MKKFVLLALIAQGVWTYYTKHGRDINVSSAQLNNNRPLSIPENLQNYQCDGRQYCSQMSSYQEAKFFIKNCPNTKMDEDHDGIPCERQF